MPSISTRRKPQGETIVQYSRPVLLFKHQKKVIRVLNKVITATYLSARPMEARIKQICLISTDQELYWLKLLLQKNAKKN